MNVAVYDTCSFLLEIFSLKLDTPMIAMNPLLKYIFKRLLIVLSDYIIAVRSSWSDLKHMPLNCVFNAGKSGCNLRLYTDYFVFIVIFNKHFISYNLPSNNIQRRLWDIFGTACCRSIPFRSQNVTNMQSGPFPGVGMMSVSTRGLWIYVQIVGPEQCIVGCPYAVP